MAGYGQQGYGTSGYGVAGATPTTGTASPSLQKLSCAATGTSTVPTFTGSAASTFKRLSTAAAGTRTVPTFTATSAATFKRLSTAATGSIATSGSASPTLKKLVCASTGVEIPLITGSVSSTLKKLSCASISVSASYSGATVAALKRLQSVSHTVRTLPIYQGNTVLTGKRASFRATAAYFTGVELPPVWITAPTVMAIISISRATVSKTLVIADPVMVPVLTLAAPTAVTSVGVSHPFNNTATVGY